MNPPGRLPVDGLVCDLDGVVYRENDPIEGAVAAVNDLKRSGIPAVFATNNATKTVTQYVSKLHDIGLPVAPDQVVTSAVVTVEEIVRRGWRDKSVFIIGSHGIREALREAGVLTLDHSEGARAELVVVSSDPHFGYEDVRVAADAVRNGAEFVATNADPTFPAPEGLRPGAGAVLAAVEVAAGREAEVMGKPHLPMMEAAARRLAGSSRIAIVGDQPGTDLAGGRAMGWTTILVLSGVTDAEAAAALDPSPDLVLDSIAALPALLA